MNFDNERLKMKLWPWISSYTQHYVSTITSKILTIESSPEIKNPTPKIVQIMTNSNMNNLSFKIIFNHQEFIENSCHYRINTFILQCLKMNLITTSNANIDWKVWQFHNHILHRSQFSMVKLQWSEKTSRKAWNALSKISPPQF